MRRVPFAPGTGFEAWRREARALLADRIPPAEVSWETGAQQTLLTETSTVLELRDAPTTARVPREFPELADALLAHSDPQSPALAYRILWRIVHGEPKLLELITDADVARARAAQKAVGRDQHKMKAFVRFREVAAPDAQPVFIAWFEPEHFIVERVAPFFVRRFAGMRWSILTPYRSVHWDGEQLEFEAGATRGDAPSEDALEDLWRTYYASIFNPARLKVKAMTSEMPVKYWKNLPEARLIPGLVREASARSHQMVAREPVDARKRVPAPVKAGAGPIEAGSLKEVREQARDCRRCELWKPATQTVFGEGPEHATVMMVGEQPGDQEDLAGKPFIGPAGKLLDEALQQAGLDRATIYVTNTVKHFKFESRGKTRLHKRADAYEQSACRPWLEAEIARVRPRIIVCMGAMAADNLLGSKFRLLKERGQWREGVNGAQLIATVHPAYLLRLPDADAREQGYRDFVSDLAAVADAVDQIAGG